MVFKFEVEDFSDNGFPKTMRIHNSKDGLIWQIYHVNDKIEQDIITEGAEISAFEYVGITNYDESYEESSPGWRDSIGFQKEYNIKKNIITIQDI